MDYQYDVAISYKSELEQTAARINDFLVEDGWEVFFAPERQQELLSEKIHQMLYGIYKNKSLMKVLLVSDNYLTGDWTALEQRVSLQSKKEDRKRLLIVNYTDLLVLPGELKSLQYLDGRKYTEDQIAALVTERMHDFVLKKEQRVDEDMKKELGRSKIISSEKTIINNNGGIIAGDNSNFGDIHL